MNRWLIVTASIGQLAGLEGLPGQTPYFPPKTVSSFETDWFGKQLSAMHEIALDRTPTEAYRFLWLRTWHAPVAVRVGALGDSGYVVLTVLTGQGGYDPGVIERQDSTALTNATWQKLRHVLAALRFWSVREHDPPERAGMDGAEWILEGHRPTMYRLVQRWSPSSVGRDAKFRAACLRMLSVAGYRPDADTVY
jgi:hypothetical protein